MADQGRYPDVETLDHVIRYSFGLRRAQMGPFQTYRIAGGEAGMRHFLAQSGPAGNGRGPNSPDAARRPRRGIPIEKIAAQSDKQAAGLSIRELERIRDENLVGILQSLEKRATTARGWELEVAGGVRAATSRPHAAADCPGLRAPRPMERRPAENSKNCTATVRGNISPAAELFR